MVGAVPRLNGVGEGPFVKMTGLWSDNSKVVNEQFKAVFGEGPVDSFSYPKIAAEDIAPKMKEFVAAMQQDDRFDVIVTELGIFGWPEVIVREK